MPIPPSQSLPALFRLARSLMALVALAALCPSQELALGGLDPVLLTRGQETAGSEDLVEISGPYSYRFATAATRSTFREDPHRFEIQWGGACARMGPLSGIGDPGRFAVHDGRIYIFASDQCREGFRKRTELFFDPDTAAPEPTADEAQRGRDLLDRAIAAHGGAERLRQASTYRHEHRTVNGETTQVHRLFVQFPDRVRVDHDYTQSKQTWRYSQISAGEDGFFLANGESRPMHESARRELRRGLLREPLWALRNVLDREAIAVARGRTEVEGTAVERLEVWVDGCTTTFGLDAGGRIRTATFRGRGPQLWFGEVTRTFDDFVERDGIVVPSTVTVTFDGEPVRAQSEQRTIEIGTALPAGIFEQPR